MSTTKTQLLKIIRMKCLDCTADQKEEVKLCPSEDCPLWPYRFAKGPYKSEMSDAQRAQRMKSLQKAWLKNERVRDES